MDRRWKGCWRAGCPGNGAGARIAWGTASDRRLVIGGVRRGGVDVLRQSSLGDLDNVCWLKH